MVRHIEVDVHLPDARLDYDVEIRKVICALGAAGPAATSLDRILHAGTGPGNPRTRVSPWGEGNRKVPA